MNFSKTSVVAKVMPLVILLTNSGADSILGCSGGTSAQGLVLWASGQPELMPKPPISMATSLSVWMLRGKPRVWSPAVG